MWRLRWKFLRDHPIPGSGLLVGPLFTIAGLVMEAYHWYELGLPALVWAAIGALIFFASVIGILFQWWSQAQAAVMWTNSAPRDADEHTIASPSQRGRLAKRIVVQGTLSVVAAAIGGTGVYLYQANRLRPLPETPSSASTEVPVRPTSPKVANAPVLKEPVSQSSNTEIGHVRLLYDHTTGTLNLISRMPDDLIVTITEISGMYTSAALGFSNYWTIRFLFPSNTGNLTAKISGDANLDCGITENKDGFMVAIARTGPYTSLFAANPVQSGELDFTFYK